MARAIAIQRFRDRKLSGEPGEADVDQVRHLARAAIAELALQPGWFVPTVKCSDGEYRGSQSFQSEAAALDYIRAAMAPDEAQLWIGWATAPTRIR